jgi:hypothetical protein
VFSSLREMEKDELAATSVDDGEDHEVLLPRT